MARLLSDALGIPFSNALPKLGRAIVHGHYMDIPPSRRVVTVFRDGRDVIVSWYYHCMFQNEFDNASLVRKMRRALNFSDPLDVRNNLPAFIELTFNSPIYPTFSWSEFVQRWLDHPAHELLVRYEDLRSDSAAELSRLVRALTDAEIDSKQAEAVVSHHTFEREAGRAPGSMVHSSYFRKGIVGDWRSHFSAESRKLFQEYAGAALLALGYEKDAGWVDADDE